MFLYYYYCFLSFGHGLVRCGVKRLSPRSNRTEVNCEHGIALYRGAEVSFIPFWSDPRTALHRHGGQMRMFLSICCYYAAWMKSSIARELSQSRFPNECSKFVGNLAQIFISPARRKERWWWGAPRLQMTFLEIKIFSFPLLLFFFLIYITVGNSLAWKTMRK